MTLSTYPISNGLPLFTITDFRVFLAAGAPHIKPTREKDK